MYFTEQQNKELMAKLHQQETLALSNQNASQASIKKLTDQLNASNNEKCQSQSRCGQLEASSTKLEKIRDEQTTLINQLKQDKDMISSQVAPFILGELTGISLLMSPV